MSEIIASVYDMMESSGLKEGILFLDEINCVSETLAPSMLQFLQYKIFGRHRVPDVWIVVTAGNPPEYNNSVREFDIVTWDRLKRIDVEPDYDVWKEYALNRGTHPAVTTYLDIKKTDFYKIESTVDGKRFVTARGWIDLSDMIRLYEKHGMKVDESLVSQYLQNPKIAKSFAIYYDLFNKYRSDYQVDQILAGKATNEIKGRAIAAKFDECLSLLGLLLDGIGEQLRAVCNAEASQTELLTALKNVRIDLDRPKADPLAALDRQVSQRRTALATGRRASSLSEDRQHALHGSIAALEEEKELLMKAPSADGQAAFDAPEKGLRLPYQGHAKTGRRLRRAAIEPVQVLRGGLRRRTGAADSGHGADHQHLRCPLHQPLRLQGILRLQQGAPLLRAPEGDHHRAGKPGVITAGRHPRMLSFQNNTKQQRSVSAVRPERFAAVQ